MKRAPEVKRSVRCSEDPVAGDSSMCAAFSVTKHGHGVGVTKKRSRKADKPSKEEEKRSEKKKRSKKKKKRTEKVAFKLEKQAVGDGFIDNKKQEERTKKPTITMGDEVMMREMEDDNTAGGGGMMKLSQELLDYLRTKEVMGLLATEAPLPLSASRMGEALFDLDHMLKEEIAAEFQENREFDVHVLYQYRTYGYANAYAAGIIKETGTEEKKKKKKKKLVTHEVSKALMGHYLSNEVWSYVMSIGVYTYQNVVISEIEESFRDRVTEDISIAFRMKYIEKQANMLRQYRTNGRAVLQYEVTDDERDVEEV